MAAKTPISEAGTQIPKPIAANLPPKPKTTRRSPKGETTRKKIIDTAERLFGQKSYETVSQRDVADEAGMLIGLVTHHYANKISLFDAVIARRAEELNRIRLQRLDAADRSSVAEIIDAFFCPLMELIKDGGDGWKNYAQLMSKMSYSEAGNQSTRIYYTPTVKIFRDAISLALPMVKRTIISQIFVYSIDMVLNALYLPNMEAIFDSAEEHKGLDTDTIYTTVRPFVLGGIEAIKALAESDK